MKKQSIRGARALAAAGLLALAAPGAATAAATETETGQASGGEAPFLYVLGVAQDGGYPQARCYAPHCLRAWLDPSLRRLTSCIALVDPDGRAAYLFDATPDLRQQLFDLQAVAPAEAMPLKGIFLTHAHIGHYTGLMHLGHEASGARNMPVYAMPRMRRFLSTNGPWDQLVRYRNIVLVPLADGEAVRLGATLRVTPMRVPHRDEYSETVGFRIDGPSRSALFIPDIDKWSRWKRDIVALVKSVDYAFLDATFFADGELPGRSMAEIPHPFVEESLRLFAELAPAEKKRIHFIHFNHTNPLLDETSDAYATVREAGFELARQGLRLPL
ncbi:MAG: MBL fold metallo-hydrolase [Pseudomonadota bacterium]